AGGTFPAAIWREFMLEALRNVPPRPFTLPRSELIVVEIDPVTGLLAAPWCPGERQKMLRQLAPTQYCPVPEIATPIATPVTTTSPTDDPEKRPRDQSPEPEPSKERSPKPKPSSSD
ncbi:MAG TPA: hypothetical protein VG106_02965, partial [Vicinamibacterales bacterium]|nr:hypothetical protein [Vicinamibacterales bacterium]